MTATLQSLGQVGRRCHSLTPLLLAMGTDNVHHVAERLGTTRRTIYRWQATGLTPHQADALAVRMGLHPAEVWSDWGADLAEVPA